MLTDANIVGLEILVPDIDDALTLFVDTLGFRLEYRAPTPNLSAETAVLDGGSMVLTLIQPVESGGPAFPDPSPRLSQLVVQVDDVRSASTEVAHAGMALQIVDESNAFITPASMEGVVGFPMALIMRSAHQPEESGSSVGPASE